MDGHQRRIVFRAIKWAAVVLVFVGLGLWCGLLWTNRSEHSSIGQAPKWTFRAPVSAHDTSSKREPDPEIPRPDTGDRSSAPIASPDAPVTQPRSVPPDGEVTLEVLCQTVTGEPVSHARIRCRTFKPVPEFPQRRLESDEVKVADPQGKFDLRARRGFHLRLDALMDSHWCRELSTRIVDSAQLVLTFYPAATVNIRALYDDGQPVTNAGMLRRHQPAASWSFALTVNGTAEVPNVAIDERLECIVFSQGRVGYGEQRVEFTSAQLASGQELLVIVRALDKPYGALRVLFAGGPAGFGGQVLIESSGRGPSAKYFSKGQSEVLVWPLWPGKQYRVTVSSDEVWNRSQPPLVWRSDWTEVPERQTVDLIAAFQVAATVRARLLDTDSRPIRNAVLRVFTGDYLQYLPGKEPQPGVRAEWRSDGHGNAVLRGLPPGRVRVEAEAWGREPVARDLELIPGDDLDLGTIALEKATGSVAVELTGMKDGLNYVAYVGSPLNGGTIYPFVRAVQGRCTIENLPLRAYYIGATLERGGSVVAEKVLLAPNQTSLIVRLDVSAIEPE